MYKTIIVPIDLAHTELAAPMIDAAKGLADADAKIIVVNVVEDIPVHVAAMLPESEDIHDKVEVNAKTALEELVKKAGVNAEVEVRTGHPPSAIISLAEDKDADLIIVASHRPDWHDYLLGSTAARVVRHAQRSVLVMR